MDMNDYPKTREEWWEYAERYWSDFLVILCQYIPTHEIASKSGRPDDTIMECTILEDILRCYNNKNKKLAVYFQLAWEMAPDSIEIHFNPSWYRFCDQCSESSVLGE